MKTTNKKKKRAPKKMATTPPPSKAELIAALEEAETALTQAEDDLIAAIDSGDQAAIRMATMVMIVAMRAWRQAFVNLIVFQLNQLVP